MKMQLFCMGHAGGNAVFYQPLKKYIDDQIQVIFIEYSGHGSRIFDPLCETMDDLVADVATLINEKRRKDIPFALFGYSMGSCVCYELANGIFAQDKNMTHLFLCACQPVQKFNKNHEMSIVSNDELIEHLKELGNFSDSFLEYPEFIDLFLPIIRNDYKVLDYYRCSQQKELFPFELSIIYSDSDDPNKCMEQWSKYTSKTCNLDRFSGNHFFISNNFDKIGRLISNRLYHYFRFW